MSAEETVERMWQQGYCGAEIAKRVGWKLARVFGYVERHRDKCPSRYNKTTQEERDEMRQMVRDGVPIQEIALYFGVSTETIYRNTRDVRWGVAQ